MKIFRFNMIDVMDMICLYYYDLVIFKIMIFFFLYCNYFGHYLQTNEK